MPGNVMSGIASSRSSVLEMMPTARTASAIITVVTGRASATLVCSMAEPSAGGRFDGGVSRGERRTRPRDELLAIEHGIDHRDDEQGQESREQHAADDRDGHGRTHLGPLAE